MNFALMVVGYIIGAIVTMLIFRRFIVGTIVVDRSDPADPPYLFLELDKDVSSITSKKYVITRVATRNYVSHD